MNVLDNFDKEANYMLASCKPEDRNNLSVKYNTIREIITILGNSIINSDIILKDTIKYLKTNVLDYLTLSDEEFEVKPDHNGHYLNKRYPDIFKDIYNIIYRKNAYYVEFTKFYHNEFKLVQKDNNIKKITDRNIYIQDAGYISDKYFTDVVIRPEHIGLFSLQSKIVLPINRLCDGDKEIYFIAKNNPKLKVLREFYNVPVYRDLNMLDKNGLAIYSIRNFKEM